MTTEKSATLYRMVMPRHQCPHGLKSKHLLESRGYKVEDNWLESRESVEQFKAQHNVDTTPQIFINDQRIGGHDALRSHLGLSVRDENANTYQPIIAIFAVAALIAVAISWSISGWSLAGELFSMRTFERFIAVSMCILGIQKLQDIERFSSMFLNYDLLAKKFVPYAYIYPFAETLAGVLMLAGSLTWIAAPMALFIGMVGCISVVKAVYLDKRELKCACVGGGSRVPLGFISLTENIMMVLMGCWMLAKLFW